MAATTLTIDVASRVTCSASAAQVRQVIVPIGAMSLWISSEYKFFLDFAATADEGAETQASQLLFHPGSYCIPIWGLGGRPVEALREVKNLYVIGANTSQYVYFMAQSTR